MNLSVVGIPLCKKGLVFMWWIVFRFELTLISLTFFLCSVAFLRLSLTGRLLTELDGRDDTLPYRLLDNLGEK